MNLFRFIFMFKLFTFLTAVVIFHSWIFSIYRYYRDRTHLSLEEATFVNYRSILNNETMIVYGIFDHHDIPRETIRMIIYFCSIKDSYLLRLKHSHRRFVPGMPYAVWCGFQGDKKFCNELSNIDRHIMIAMICILLTTMFILM